MRKILFCLGLLSITVSGVLGQLKSPVVMPENTLSAKEQKGDEWAVAPDFTSKDINNNEHSLYADYLNQGKIVIIDFSATWCPPCWDLHQTHVLNDVYNTYGPDGTDELTVLWVEVDDATTADDLAGTGSSTQGDWITGTPFPIIDDGSFVDNFTLYPGGVPTVFIIYPNGAYKIASGDAWNGFDAMSALLDDEYPATDQVPEVDYLLPQSVYTDMVIRLKPEVVSLSDVAYSWIFEGGEPQVSDAKSPAVKWSTPGTYSVSFTGTNDNGESETLTKQIVVKEKINEPQYLQYDNGENFTSIGNSANPIEFEVAACWFPSDIDFLEGMAVSKIAFIPLVNTCNYSVKVLKGTNGSTELSKQACSDLTINEWNETVLENPVPIDVNKKLYIAIENINTVGATSASVDQSLEFDGRSNLLRMLGDPTWKKATEYGLGGSWNVKAFVDIYEPSIVEDLTADELSIYPNPVNNELNIRCDYKIMEIILFDVSGAEIKREMPQTNMFQIEMSELNNGIYFIRVETEKGRNIKKILKN